MHNGSGDDNWSYKSWKAPVKSLPPTNQHPAFYRPDALPVAQPTVSKHWRDNITFHVLAYPKITWGFFQLCLWPLITLWLPWWRVAMPFISPLLPVPPINDIYMWHKNTREESPCKCPSMHAHSPPVGKQWLELSKVGNFQPVWRAVTPYLSLLH